MQEMTANAAREVDVAIVRGGYPTRDEVIDYLDAYEWHQESCP